MKLVFYSVVLNQHQAPVADELWELTGHRYAFVELKDLGDTKGGTEDYSNRPYLIRAWESQESFDRAMLLARTAECCVFGGTDALPFEKERMRLGLLSFDMGERWLKRGWQSLASPRLMKWLSAYYIGGWRNKPLYKLCMSGYAAGDHNKLGTFKGKCYKWGYFTKVDSPESLSRQSETDESKVRLMWCARYLDWKHPELPVFLAQRLKNKGYSFHLDMYGDGECREATEQLVERLSLGDFVTIFGNKPNEQVRDAMKQSDIFLFTSDRYEGWGAVANESMSCGCALIASDAIGSTPYLVNDGVNGYIFTAPSPSSSLTNPDRNALGMLTKKVIVLINNKIILHDMQRNAIQTMRTLWSPKHAADSLLHLISDFHNGKDTSIAEGPCSQA